MNYEQRTRSRLEAAVRDIFSAIEVEKPGIRFIGIAGAVKRKSMVKNIDMAAKHYDLRQEVDAFLAENDCVTVAGLEDPKLKALSNWLSSVMDRLSYVCDHPDAPCAR